MVHSDDIWNDFETQRIKWTQRRQTVNSDDIWNDFETAENKMKTKTANGAFWRYLKRFETAENKMKTKTVNGAFWWYLKWFGIAEKKMKSRTEWCILMEVETAMRKNSTCFDLINVAIWYDISTCRENVKSNEFKWCILTLFDTKCWNVEKNWKQWI